MVTLANLSSLISPSSLPTSLSSAGSPKKSPPASVPETPPRTKSPPKSNPPVTPPPRFDKGAKKQQSVPTKSSSEPTVEELNLTGNVNKMKDLFQTTPTSPPPPVTSKPHPFNRGPKPATNGVSSSPSHKTPKPVKVKSVDVPSSPSRPLSPPQKVSPILPPPTKQKPVFPQRSRGPILLKKSDSYDHLDAKIATPISASSFSAEEVILSQNEEEEKEEKKSSRPSFSSNGKKFFANLVSRQDTPSKGSDSNEKSANKFGQAFKQKKTTPTSTSSTDLDDSKKSNGQGGGGKVSVKIFGKKTDNNNSIESSNTKSADVKPGSPSKGGVRPAQHKMLQYENVSVKPTKPLERLLINNTDTSSALNATPSVKPLKLSERLDHRSADPGPTQNTTPSVKPTKPLDRSGNTDPSPTQNATPTAQPYKVTVISSNGPSVAPPPTPPTLPEYAVVNKTNKVPPTRTISPPTRTISPPTHTISPPTLPEYAVVNKTNKVPPTHVIAPPTHVIAPPTKAVSPPPLLPPQYSDEDFNSCSSGNEKLQRNAYENIFFLGNEEDEDEGEILNDSGFRNDEIIYENFGPDRGNRWMTTTELQQYINDKGKKELSAEYLKIKNEPLTGTSDVFRLACNTSKNRYKDVVCYDSTRVVLSKQPDVEGSDYIHANYINGYKKERAVILTQGPLKRTVNDYWKMLWEQNVFVIVMATKCIETRKLKCAQYWPDGNGVATFGDIMVKVVRDEIIGSYQFRQFSASRNGETRSLMHYQFLAWPDYGVPATGSEVLDVLYAARTMQECFREHVRDPDKFPIHGPPMVIHCSAGIGRSGTFCSLDYCIDELRMTNKVNVQNCVRLLRKQRAFSIQTDEQYVFCYKTVLDYALYLKEALHR